MGILIVTSMRGQDFLHRETKLSLELKLLPGEPVYADEVPSGALLQVESVSLEAALAHHAAQQRAFEELAREPDLWDKYGIPLQGES